MKLNSIAEYASAGTPLKLLDEGLFSYRKASLHANEPLFLKSLATVEMAIGRAAHFLATSVAVDLKPGLSTLFPAVLLNKCQASSCLKTPI